MTLLRIAVGFMATALAAQTGQVSSPPQTPESALGARFQLRTTSRYDEIFRKYTKQYFGPGFDWKVFKAQAMAESGLSESAHSWVGARGLMQLMPATYREIQTKNPELANIDDPRWNIAAGIFYDKKLYDAWSEMGSLHARLSYLLGSYNAGRGTMLNAKDTVRKAGQDEQQWRNVELNAPKVPRWRYPETLGYVRKIQSFYGALSARNGFDAFLPPPAGQMLPPK